VTISDNLILAKLSDDGNAITVTGNATTTRTIAGSGSLEASTFAQTPNVSLTGMTGAIGSGITGGSGLNAVSPANLASGVLPVGVTGGSGLDAVPAALPHFLTSALTSTSITYGGGTPPIFLTLIIPQGSIVNQSSVGKIRCFYHFNITDTSIVSPNVYGSVSGGKAVTNDLVLDSNNTGSAAYAAGSNVGYWDPFTNLGSYGSGDLTVTFALYRAGGNNMILNASNNFSAVTIIEMLA